MANVTKSRTGGSLEQRISRGNTAEVSGLYSNPVPQIHLVGKCPETGRVAPRRFDYGRHARFFGISLAVHAVLILLVASITRGPRVQPPVTIDFTISSAQATEDPRPSPPARENTPVPERKSIASHAEPVMPATPPTTPVTRDNEQSFQKQSDVATAQAPRENQPAARASEPQSTHRTAARQAEGSGPASGGGVSGNSETMRTRYMKEQFSYIRDKIASHVRYPRHAKRMGWSGVAHVSFVIEENGAVSDVKVVKSSQVSLLDEDASESVRRSAPFPRPPVRARIVIPVEYVIG